MSDERNVLAALAVMLIAYALVGLLAMAAGNNSAEPRLRRWWRRLRARATSSIRTDHGGRPPGDVS